MFTGVAGPTGTFGKKTSFQRPDSVHLLESSSGLELLRRDFAESLQGRRLQSLGVDLGLNVFFFFELFFLEGVLLPFGVIVVEKGYEVCYFQKIKHFG